MTPEDAPESAVVRRTSRDFEAVRVSLERWLRRRLPDAADVAIPELSTTSATGMSSETLLFTAEWTEGGSARSERLVGRAAPDPADVPVFPSYDLTKQFEALRLVAEHSDVPVPKVIWNEPEPASIGTPFFVMERIDGVVPPDNLPYAMGGNWLFDAAPDDRRRLQDATVDVLSQLHAIDRPLETFAFLEFSDAGATHLHRHVAHARAWYDYAARGGQRSPLVERGFGWLEDHWPAAVGDAVLSWGDSRIGNVMYRDFRPVAVLDWEMVGLGPREVDLGWLVYAHRAFHTMATGWGMPGMPDFLRPDDVASRYEEVSGHTPRDLDWYIAYAAVQWGVVGLITGLRAVHFGEREMPDDVDELLYNRGSLEPIVA
jgi:aminoglycoside phosphotransferase (APT) family kinase protein